MQPWRKSQKRKEKRNFSTTYLKTGTQSALRRKSDETIQAFEGNDAEKQNYDPVRRDRFFVIPESSEYWPPSEEVKVRLKGKTWKMTTFDKTKSPGGSDNGSTAKKVKAVKKDGELKIPKNVNLEKRRKALDVGDDSD